MHSDEIEPTDPPAPPAASPASLDPNALKNAHGRTGRMLQHAGLPFEDEEFEEASPQGEDEPSAPTQG